MKRNITFLPPLAIALLLGLAACAGKTVSVGTNGTTADELRSVTPASLTGSVPPCATAAQAHPNVCCTGGKNEAAACVAYVNKPFHKCADGANTYPDPEQCCDLSNPASCVRPPPPPPGGGGGNCGYVCQPGWYANGPNTCCQAFGPDANGVSGGVCESWANAGTVTGNPAGPPTYVDGGIAPGEPPPPDAGVVYPPPPQPVPLPNPDQPPCAYPVDQTGPDTPVIGGGPTPAPGPGPKVPPPNLPACPPPPPSICNIPCPPGFTAAINDPAICCQDTPEGDICFSQAQGPSSGGGYGGISGGGSGGGTVGSTPPNGGPTTTCAPLPCPSGAPWDPKACACVKG